MWSNPQFPDQKQVLIKLSLVRVTFHLKIDLILCQCSTSIPTENIRKPPVFWCFQGHRSGTFVENGLMENSSSRHTILRSLIQRLLKVDAWPFSGFIWNIRVEGLFTRLPANQIVKAWGRGYFWVNDEVRSTRICNREAKWSS